jgi:hypothetical protein
MKSKKNVANTDAGERVVYQIRIKGHLAVLADGLMPRLAPRLADHSDAASQPLGKKRG